MPLGAQTLGGVGGSQAEARCRGSADRRARVQPVVSHRLHGHPVVDVTPGCAPILGMDRNVRHQRLALVRCAGRAGLRGTQHSWYLASTASQRARIRRRAAARAAAAVAHAAACAGARNRRGAGHGPPPSPPPPVPPAERRAAACRPGQRERAATNRRTTGSRSLIASPNARSSKHRTTPAPRIGRLSPSPPRKTDVAPAASARVPAGAAGHRIG